MHAPKTLHIKTELFFFWKTGYTDDCPWMISFELHACSSRPTVTRRLISEWRIHIAHLMLLSTLSECKVRRYWSDLISPMRVVAEFWSLIEPAIPGIVALVKDSVGKAVRPGTVVFSKFSSQFMGHWHGLALLMKSQQLIDVDLQSTIVLRLSTYST